MKRTAIMLSALVLIVAACGDDDAATTTSQATSAPATTAAPSTTAAATTAAPTTTAAAGLLHTAAPVVMVDRTGTFRGDGFRYYVHERKFHLLGNVSVEQNQ